jgi:hypothetical protein
MSRRFARRIGEEGIRYRIVIRGRIAEPLVGPLEGMTLEPAGPESVLSGEIVDQAQLQGAFSWLSSVGVEIVSVNPEAEPTASTRRNGHA